ncbi:hypothetical protein [Paracraurococcus lichenis]|uniref:Uncharacterized protein n=1 Tax=Paracraurococcus lichenis TaxID=3064888 RepID=A0ABT9DYC1_9PROT|nr:hypothetical protein [Paracraurococcus sp. LOR1-02]MDO9708909.1 hypothetical protein [Paracraurococcus sp. LOR1-02]
MLPTTILIDGTPKCVVRPNDGKALNRFLRNARPYLLGTRLDAAITHRTADERERARWQEALDLHRASGGEEEEFFGTPL